MLSHAFSVYAASVSRKHGFLLMSLQRFHMSELVEIKNIKVATVTILQQLDGDFVYVINKLKFGG